MTKLTLDEIKQDVDGFVSRVRAGEPLLLVEADHPVAELAPVNQHPSGSRPYGLCAGEFTVPDDFNDSLPDELLARFEGE